MHPSDTQYPTPPNSVQDLSTEAMFADYGVIDEHVGPGNLIGKIAFVRATEQMEAQFAATHDQLTGLLNRRGLDEALAANAPPRAVLVVDGDEIKSINDKLGHARGDHVIVNTAQALTESVRPEDIVARTGGDEFVVIFSSLPRKATVDQPELTPLQLVTLARERIGEKTREIVADPDNSDLRERGINFGMSVGGAVWQEGMNTSDLIKAADANMYVQKRAKKAAQGRRP